MEEKKFNYGKTFLLGFGFFGVSVIWSVYNAFVPLMLDGKFGLQAGWIGFIMVLDNVAALFIQPPLVCFLTDSVHLWADACPLLRWEHRSRRQCSALFPS